MTNWLIIYAQIKLLCMQVFLLRTPVLLVTTCFYSGNIPKFVEWNWTYVLTFLGPIPISRFSNSTEVKIAWLARLSIVWYTNCSMQNICSLIEMHKCKPKACCWARIPQIFAKINVNQRHDLISIQHLCKHMWYLFPLKWRWFI